MQPRIAVFGGSFNPPGLHHRRLAERLTEEFDKVIVVPCGPRPDKPTTNDVEPIHRAVMVDLTFRGIPNVEIELFDLEQSTFTRTHELQEKFRDRGEIWHVVGTDAVQGGCEGKSFIHQIWDHGSVLWNSLNFAIVNRPGYEPGDGDLPRNSILIGGDYEGSSFAARERAFRRESLVGLVTPEVAAYVDRYRLYRGTVVGRTAKLMVDEPRLHIVYDERNPKAAEIAAQYARYESSHPNMIFVVGGDGTMLQAIRKYWRERLPFFGLNAGHLGFLLNARDEVPSTVVPEDDLLVHHLPLLYVETEGANGVWTNDLAFNDTWLERASSQTSWLEVRINGNVRIPRLVSDGILLSTAAGSTAYARSMGAPPLLADTPAMVLVGSNVMSPPDWKSALLSLDSLLECVSLGGDKRPIHAYVDGVYQGEIHALRARVSRIAAVELAFVPNHDMAEKIAQLQFPRH